MVPGGTKTRLPPLLPGAGTSTTIDTAPPTSFACTSNAGASAEDAPAPPATEARSRRDDRRTPVTAASDVATKAAPASTARAARTSRRRRSLCRSRRTARRLPIPPSGRGRSSLGRAAPRPSSSWVVGPRAVSSGGGRSTGGALVIYDPAYRPRSLMQRSAGDGMRKSRGLPAATGSTRHPRGAL